MRTPLIAMLTQLAACSLSDERFQEDYPDALCTYYQSCDPPFFDDQGECVEEQQEDLPEVESCTFDKDTANACLDALEGRTCEGSARNLPESCDLDTIYDCSGGE